MKKKKLSYAVGGVVGEDPVAPKKFGGASAKDSLAISNDYTKNLAWLKKNYDDVGENGFSMKDEFKTYQ